MGFLAENFPTPSDRLDPAGVTDGMLEQLAAQVTRQFDFAAAAPGGLTWDGRWFDWAGKVLVEEIIRSEGG